MPTPAIGYVTSGNLDSGRFTVSGAMKTFYDKFKDGLVTVDSPDGTKWNPAQGGNVEIETRSADGDYDAQDSRQTLNNHVNDLNGDRDVKLIVAVGGLVSAFAATKHSTKPFLVIIGQVPATDDFALPDPTAMPPTYCGGINLNSPAANRERNKRVVARLLAGSPQANPIVPADSSAQAKDVCLIFNENARMTKAERNIWKSYGWPAVAGGSDVEGDNDEEDFERALKKAKRRKKAKGIVVSADPFFQHKQQEFTQTAAKNAFDQMVFCYPSKYFGGKSKRDIWYGPDLWVVYEKLGAKAGQLLTEIAKGGGGPKFMGLDDADLTGADF